VARDEPIVWPASTDQGDDAFISRSRLPDEALANAIKVELRTHRDPARILIALTGYPDRPRTRIRPTIEWWSAVFERSLGRLVVGHIYPLAELDGPGEPRPARPPALSPTRRTSD
jgi:hypothetical protein